MTTAALASLAAGAATGLGALPVIALVGIGGRTQAALLGFGAGVMLAASVFSLVVPALEAAGGGAWAAAVASAGMLLGAGGLWSSHRWLPHEHFVKGREGADAVRLRRVWLFVLAITLHNFPEGLAVGVGFGARAVADPWTLTLGIGLQNVPEGLVVAAALRGEGYGRGQAALTSLCSGLVEPLGAVLGAAALALATPLLPWGLAAAAGAMLWVVSDEIIPESHRLGTEQEGTAGLLLGFVLMMTLDVGLA